MKEASRSLLQNVASVSISVDNGDRIFLRISCVWRSCLHNSSSALLRREEVSPNQRIEQSPPHSRDAVEGHALHAVLVIGFVNL